MPRITDASDLGQLNRALSGIDDLQRQFGQLNKQLGAVNHQIQTINTKQIPATTNNLQFVWTGSTTTLSWGNGSVNDRENINVPVRAGSLILAPSSYYWLAWNSVHQQMAAQVAADGLLQNQNNIVICQIFTGTSGQSGVAGGGASSGNSDLSGARYKLF